MAAKYPFFSREVALKSNPNKIMIRQFTIFCKLNFCILCDIDLFLKSMEDFTCEKIPFLKLACPNCGAKEPLWSFHDTYSRFLISYENKTVVTEAIEIPRLLCSSCNCTHAILPEILVPYKSYGLLFILTVLKEYFFRHRTVTAICEKYQISVSTLYRWKKLFLLHKQLWLGVVENIYHDTASFISTFPAVKTSEVLSEFFKENNKSFLQGAGKTAYFSSA